MENTLYVSDLDGTLLNDSTVLSAKTIEIVNELTERGMLFTYATARSFSSAGKLTCGLRLNLPLVTYNGAMLVKPESGEIIEVCLLDKKRIEGLMLEITRRGVNPLVYSFIGGIERVSWIKGRESGGTLNYTKSRSGDPRLRPVDSYDDLFDGDIFYFTIIGSKDEIHSARSICADNDYLGFHAVRDTYNEDEYWLEFFRFDADKKHAVNKLKKYTNASELVCFGDNLNDLPMFSAADRAYAVAEAKPELKKTAYGVIGSNNEDGVAQFILEDYSKSKLNFV